MDLKQEAKNILKLVGGSENIISLIHCATRLRFNLKNNAFAMQEELKNLESTIGVQFQGDQLQVIIGNQVAGLYKEIIALVPALEETPMNTEKKKFSLNMIMDILSGCFGPIIAPLAGAGIFKGFITMAISFHWLLPDADFVKLGTVISDSVFYFLPFLLAASAAKKFKTNQYLALTLAGAYMYPTILNGAAEHGAWHLFGLPIPLLNYSCSVIPIILSVWLLSHVYRKVEKHIPGFLKIIFVPLIVLTIMIPIQLVAFGPLGSYFGKYLAVSITWLFDKSAILAGLIVGATRPLVILTGMHYSLFPVNMGNLAEYGYDVLAPLYLLGTLACGGACLGVYFASKKSETKQIALSSGISAVIGITEPSLYGILIRFKRPLYAAMAAGGISGAFCAVMGGKSYAGAMPSILSLPIYYGPEFVYVLISMGLAFGLAAVFAYFLKIDEKPELNKTNQGEAENHTIKIYSPISGKIVNTKEIPDATMSQELLGKTIAVMPSKGRVIAPFDGTVTALLASKHAVGLKSDQGVELLIHIGIDTVQLKGKHFTTFVQQGQNVRKGDLLIEFEKEEMEKEGINLVTPIIISNSKEFQTITFTEENLIFEKELLCHLEREV